MLVPVSLAEWRALLRINKGFGSLVNCLPKDQACAILGRQLITLRKKSSNLEIYKMGLVVYC